MVKIAKIKNPTLKLEIKKVLRAMYNEVLDTVEVRGIPDLWTEKVEFMMYRTEFERLLRKYTSRVEGIVRKQTKKSGGI